jgi:hypothetical protein
MKYIVEITGLASCLYEISYSSTHQKLYEVVHGHMFSLELKPEEKVYLLYFHTRDKPFRVVSMPDYGII